MKKNIAYLVVLMLLLGIFFIPSVRDFVSNQFFPVATIEKAISLEDSDYNVQLKGINVPDANLKDFKGKKVVFLNFWGTWCEPCRREWPTIQALYEAKKDKMDFVLIAMQDKEDNVRAFLKENTYSVPVYLAESPISNNILPKSFPTTFILDKNGHILQKEDATKDWNSKSVHEFLENFFE